MVATPVLSGAFLRILMGILVEQFKPKMAGVIGQIIVIVSLFVAWFFGVHSFQQALILGGMLGFAGASFAVSLPLASRWYPPEHQGTALGIAGAGNSGTVFAALFAPSLAVAYGWNNVLGLAVLPLVVVLIIYLILAKDSPDNPPAKSFADYVEVLKDKDSWWFMFFYCVTFGGFVGMASSLTIYFNDQYALSAIHAGYFTAACVFAGSLVRPIGGFFSDRFGGIKTLSWMYAIAATFLAILSLNLNHQVAALIVAMVTMIALGMGNGAVFQLVPQRFRKEIGIMTGIVGMAGGVGGFYLASSLGFSKQITGSYSLGLIVFSLLALVALVGLTIIKNRWRTTWGSATVTTAKI
ncbi:MAG: NarK/NasA family nitrate transporter, partial [Nitrosomonadales bacterium]|nr:NarK/NasA family nitrate transporter [Nitrosomonadales bacterium]